MPNKYITIFFVTILGLGVATTTEASPPLADNGAIELIPKPDGLFHVDYKFAAESEVDVDTPDPATVGVQHVQISATVPILRRSGFALTATPKYSMHMFKLRGGALSLDSDVEAHEIGVKLGYVGSLGPQSALVIALQPTIASDFEEVNGDDFVPIASALWAWRFSRTSLLMLGAGVSREFGELLPFPIVGLTFAPSSSGETEPRGFYVSALLPQFAKVGYEFNDTFGAFLKATYTGAAWHFNPVANADGFYAKYQTVSAGLGVDVRITNGMVIDIHGGIDAVRKIDFDDGSGNGPDADLKPGAFATAGFKITPALFK